ncbi:MAG: hypothetical protein M1820_003068 [Bogoriella megaspora]|nr:MAG: hypothetical protein M1820_003068 [Bogoriella megaspora]
MTNNYYIFGPNHSVENIGGNARNFQGQVISPPPVDLLDSPRPIMSAVKVSKSVPSEDRAYDEGSGSSPISQDENMSLLDQKLNDLALDAVSFQTEVIASERNRNKVEERRCAPKEEHYNDNDKFNFEKGDFFRIWHPANTDVHLTTFLVIGIKGTNMTCLRIVHRDPDEADYDFERAHVKLRVEKYIPGVPRRTLCKDPESFLVVMNKSQNFKEHCWINLLNSENIDWRKEYRFARCGRLDDDSLERARSEHLRLYEAKLR